MNILITGAWSDWENCREALEEMGHEVAFTQQEKDPLPVAYEWVEGTICNGLFLHHDIDQFVNLKYIQLTSAGTDRVPEEKIRARGIRLHNAWGVYSVPMAEFAFGGVLQLYKKSRYFADNQRLRRWEKHRGLQELAGKTVCILGCGSVGTACAKRFRAFDCRVVGVARSSGENPDYDEILPVQMLDAALSRSDIVVLTLPLTADTRYLMDRSRFAAMKPGSILVNIARGAIVDAEALIQALEEKLGGAVLDVFEEEPLAPHCPLWDMEHVILTPHNSFVGQGNGARLARIIMDNLEKKHEDSDRFTEK